MKLSLVKTEEWKKGEKTWPCTYLENHLALNLTVLDKASK